MATAPPTTTTTTGIGADVARLEGREKVTGAARYAYERRPDEVAYAVGVQSTIARGRIRELDPAAALAQPGVLTVLSHANAPELQPVDDPELAVLQSDQVAYRGQLVAVVVADTLEVAQDAARAVTIVYDEDAHDSVLTAEHPRLYKPEKVNPRYEPDTEDGDVPRGLDAADVVVDATYTTPAQHNNPMEPHATTAWWEGDAVVLHDSSQGAARARDTLAKVLKLAPVQVRVIAEHVGGAFGSKGTPRPNAVLAAIASRAVGRPVKLMVTRRQMFAVVGYRTPTIQRMRLGATRDGRITALVHDAVVQSSTLKPFAEQCAVASRMMYAAGARRTTHRLAQLDVPTPSWMRAPGECPGMWALESAIDELAWDLGMDPIELRARNEPDVDPETGDPFSSRGLIPCLRQGAERFGWADRAETPGTQRDGRWRVGVGVAAATYPARRGAASASARAEDDGSFEVRIAAADLGTGARTVLWQIAAEALGAPGERVRIRVGDSRLPDAPVAGGSAGTASWGSAVVKACRELRVRLADEDDEVPAGGIEVLVDTKDEVEAQAPLARHAFGAHFVEVRIDADTGEVRVPRMLGVFAAGRIVNPRTARSQLIGGMLMGISMALHEEGVMDARFGDYVNRDLAMYHVPVCADVGDIDATWIEEDDPHLNPMGAKGIGEIGIVGSAAAVANAVFHATGRRIRDLPIRVEDVL